MSTAFPGNFPLPIPRNQVRGISCNPFRGNSRNSIQGISCNQLQGISCYQFFRKTRENLQQKGLQNQFLGISLELFPRFSQEFLRKILKYSLTKVVNNLTTILPLQLFRSITIFLSQNVIVGFDLTEVVMYFVYSDK